MGGMSPSGSNVLLLIASLLCCELTARIAFPVPEVPGFNRIYFSRVGLFSGLDEVAKTGGSPGVGVSYAPPRPLRNVQISWISDPDGIDQPMNLNLYGFRGDDFEIAKAAGSTRILFLGDSFVEGFGVGDDDTIPEAFRRSLDQPDVEGLNLGIGGSVMTDVARLATIAIPLLEPDYVAVIVYGNDLPTSPFRPDLLPRWSPPARRHWWVPRLLHVGVGLAAGNPPALFYHRGPYPFFRPVPHPANPLSLSNSPLPKQMPAAVVEAIRAGRFNPFVVTPNRPLEEQILGPFEDSNSGRPYLSYVLQICREHGTGLLVGYIPFNVVVSDHYYPFWKALGEQFDAPSLANSRFYEHQRQLEAITSALGVPFVDPTEALTREEAEGRRMFAEYDGHMTREGYALVAAHLVEAFREERLQRDGTSGR